MKSKVEIEKQLTDVNKNIDRIIQTIKSGSDAYTNAVGYKHALEWVLDCD